jgi:hypothetical protein
MRVVLRLFVVLISLLSLLAGASAYPEVLNASLLQQGYRESPLYAQTLRFCRSNPAVFNPAFMETSAFKNVFFQTADQSMGATLGLSVPDLVAFYSEHGLSTAYADLVSDPSFVQAIDDCTHGDTRKGQTVYLRLLFADLSGSAAGILPSALAICVSYGVSKALYKKFPISPKRMRIAGLSFAAGSLASLIYGDRYYLGISKPSKAQQAAAVKTFNQMVASGPCQLLQENMNDFNTDIAQIDLKLKGSEPSSAQDKTTLASRRSRLAGALEETQASYKTLQCQQH